MDDKNCWSEKTENKKKLVEWRAQERGKRWLVVEEVVHKTEKRTVVVE